MPTRAHREPWELPHGVTYLNHGSFGLSPRSVRAACDQWRRRMCDEPMDFFVRQLEPAWYAARDRLASFVGAQPDNVTLIDNATSGMNVVAQSVRLHRDEHVLLTDHEYGAVYRIWEHACARQETKPPVVARIPLPITTAEDVVESLWEHVTPTTRVMVISHITSATALTLPIELICKRAAQHGIITCVDGPHALGQLPLQLDQWDCDYYVASCHKWFCAPLGSGFLYAHPRQHARVVPLVRSWGRLLPARPQHWTEEFLWNGTRDLSPMLAIAETCQFWSADRLAAFRTYSHELAQYARSRLEEFADRAPLAPDASQWYTSMAHMPLPPGPAQPLQIQLWERFGIEVPIIEWQDQRYIRVSCHLYNQPADIDFLIDALRQCL